MNMKLKSVMLGAAMASVAAMPVSNAIAKDYPPKTLSMVAPSGAGGGWDLTIRTVAKTLKDTKLVKSNMPVTNRPGGGGAVNLAYMQTQVGKDNLISVYSPPILLTNLNGSSKFSYKDTTPLGRLITDYAAFVVSKDSKYTSINQVMDALRKDPKSVKIGGTSSAGSMDHIQFLMIAKAAGVPNLSKIDYISFQDGGAVAQVLGGHVDLISTGLGDVTSLVKSGNLRALAQTADKRIGSGVIADIPTVKEQGIDATFENWRGLFGPKDMPEYAVTFWNKTLKEMTETQEWSEARTRNGWDDAYQNSEQFNKFLAKTNEQYKEILNEVFSSK
ncbi:Bug family tripartite tricarboxylate transporter substrate binding protein [Vibrio sp. SCSIO 43137]|uniref:Bug family tripartite tricarboxylate transporter substrate binding protein n=1 Tax=Vibrio sp. SCSIO 43137 TaxID=3021011 RepID=UPI002307BB52|nr:tripartite tricarboxylate transporter substrate-binding protein [Vibrio sp. SCSIO 43137]WCE31386.1 tripartite tricarboxylate transporter substrate-binding protein [Vibrio sp. SCSIO 43137]